MEIFMFNKIGFTILGLILIFLGIGIINDPVICNDIYRVTLNATGYNVFLGIFMIIVGIAFIWTSFSSKNRKAK